MVNNQLIELLENNEDWLMDRTLTYAKERNYSKYTSTLKEAWRLSVNGLTSSLVDFVKQERPDFELGPDEDYELDPAAQFGIVEARLHRQRGISLSMFLGLMKYYRRSYFDLIETNCSSWPQCIYYQRIIELFFDRVEIGFIVEWASKNESQLVKELEKSNRIMTNEKNKFLTIFESLTAPVVVLDKSDKIVSLNLAASSLFLDEQTPGSSYYRTDPFNKMPFQYSVEEIMPWAVKGLIGFKQGGFERLSLETRLHSGNKTQYYSVIFSPMLDISGKFGGTIIILEEITDQIMAEKARLKSERLKAIIETAGAVSHEINQPLQIALGAIDLAMMENPEDRNWPVI